MGGVLGRRMFLWWELGEGIKDREGGKGSFGGGGVEIIKNGFVVGVEGGN
jgi:hypothetical protein